MTQAQNSKIVIQGWVSNVLIIYHLNFVFVSDLDIRA